MRDVRVAGLVLLVVAAATLLALVQATPEAWFPLQFSGNLEITSHLLPDDSEYPPNKRRLMIFYDYINKRARADIEAGYEAAKFYIRRYDTKKEYMIRLPPIDDCKRSYLGEQMPFPEIPADTKFIDEVIVNGERCNHFEFLEFDIRVHMYFSLEGVPVKLFQERIDEITGLSVPLLTYDYYDVALEPPDASWFELPAPHEHRSCPRHVGGFPYLHIFHYFVKM